MTQRELNRAVARATGETIDRIARTGFTLIAAPPLKPYWRRPYRRPVTTGGECVWVPRKRKGVSHELAAAR